MEIWAPFPRTEWIMLSSSLPEWIIWITGICSSSHGSPELFGMADGRGTRIAEGLNCKLPERPSSIPNARRTAGDTEVWILSTTCLASVIERSTIGRSKPIKRVDWCSLSPIPPSGLILLLLPLSLLNKLAIRLVSGEDEVTDPITYGRYWMLWGRSSCSRPSKSLFWGQEGPLVPSTLRPSSVDAHPKCQVVAPCLGSSTSQPDPRDRSQTQQFPHRPVSWVALPPLPQKSIPRASCPPSRTVGPPLQLRTWPSQRHKHLPLLIFVDCGARTLMDT